MSDRSELPTGTVTLLFTDIEGSTALLERLGDAYGDVLALHHATLRGIWTSHRGVEVKTDGDAFFVAFESATDAVAAARAGQEALAAAAWPAGAELRVRIAPDLSFSPGPMLLERSACYEHRHWQGGREQGDVA